MTVKELRIALSHFPDEAEVIMDSLGTYNLVTKVRYEEGVPRMGWILKKQPNMSVVNTNNIKTYVWIGTTL